MSDKALVGWKGRGEEAGGSHEAHLIRKERAVVGLLHVQLHVCGNRSKGDSGGGCERADQVRARGAACAQAMEKCACAWRKRRWRGNARCMTLQALVRGGTRVCAHGCAASALAPAPSSVSEPQMAA